ncbi:hypothetical protein HJG60_007780 [Phyllostomus discolor]|uniref:Uncharacterized protein n=1 Tax=Phyllostomus discolor TaxID=89673 RepID=A0A834BI67_9CHIR|nr:hypothetical protein HJG60_007780 [Phyllostomus discolor]
MLKIRAFFLHLFADQLTSSCHRTFSMHLVFCSSFGAGNSAQLHHLTLASCLTYWAGSLPGQGLSAVPVRVVVPEGRASSLPPVCALGCCLLPLCLWSQFTCCLVSLTFPQLFKKVVPFLKVVLVKASEVGSLFRDSGAFLNSEISSAHVIKNKGAFLKSVSPPFPRCSVSVFSVLSELHSFVGALCSALSSFLFAS